MTSPARSPFLFLWYTLLLLAAVALFLAIRAWGETLTAPPAPDAAASEPTRPGDGHILAGVLLALATILVVGRLLGRLAAWVGQPPVIGEVIAGILLGPSVLGHLWPQATQFLLPPTAVPYLGLLAQVGVLLYLFLVGLELDPGLLRRHAHAAVAISHASIVIPFTLGAALALWLYPKLSHQGVDFTSFALFLGVAMAITAFPVLARILTDRGLEKSDLGVLALGCAAVDDITAWCLLALVVGVVQAQVSGAVVVCVLAVAYVSLMLAVIRPLALRYLSHLREEDIGPGLVAGVFLALLLSALATEAIGIHALFGGFLMGCILPHDGALAKVLKSRLQDLVLILLLPAFFAYTGLRTQIGLIGGWEAWLICLAIIAVATLGKFGGTLAAGRWTGLSWHTSACLGILMNTRGLMQLIVLNIGLELRVISPTLYAMMVVMALATTLATAPVLHWLGVKSAPDGSIAFTSSHTPREMD